MAAINCSLRMYSMGVSYRYKINVHSQVDDAFGRCFMADCYFCSVICFASLIATALFRHTLTVSFKVRGP